MKKTFLTILGLWLAITFCTVNLHPFFLCNDCCRAYDSCGGEGAEALTCGLSIGQLTVQGGGYFLMSHSEMIKFLNEIEMSEVNGLNYTKLQSIIDLAIANMENATEIYRNIVEIAKETPYNQGILMQLRFFDYQGYQEKNQLNIEIFAKVKEYLIAGDVTGTYIQLKADMDDILNQLYKIKSDIDAKKFPEISNLWRVNQKFNLTMLFGMYLSEVFINL